MARKAKARADWGTSALSRARQRGDLPEAVRGALAASGGVVSRAAAMLGVTRRHLYFVCEREHVPLVALALAAREAAATSRTV